MSDVQNIITLGIGSAPGDIHFFLLLGLDVSAPSAIGHAVASDAMRYHAATSDAMIYNAVATDDHG